LGIERCGKIHAVNSVSESWTGIGVVAGFAAVMLITQRPHVKNVVAHWGIKLLHILQELGSICKTRHHLADNLGDLDGAGLGVDLRIAGDAVIGNGSSITAESWAAGRAGALQMTVGNLPLTGGAAIDTSSNGAGRGGQLTVAASNAISIRGRDSEGNLSALFSNTFTDGDAGRVSISAAKLMIDDGVIEAGTASHSRGNAGNIELRVGTLTLTGGLRSIVERVAVVAEVI
jgi:hypothetical protein